MAVFRIEKTKDYTIMSNYHLRDRDLTLKAKGLISLMLSLPDSWDYSLAGLSCICNDGISSIRSGVAELEQHGYLSRSRVRESNGQLGDIEYLIHEKPVENIMASVDNPPPTSDKPTYEKPICENPTLGKPTCDSMTRLNNNKSNTQGSITYGSNIHPSIRPELPSGERGAKPDTIDTMEIYRTIIKTNIGYEYLRAEHRTSAEEIDEILELMVEAVCSTKATIRIGGEDKPTELVKRRLLSIDQSHVDYLLETLSKNTSEVRNIRAYLLTSLYNAPSTIGNYYKARVNHDLYGGGT